MLLIGPMDNQHQLVLVDEPSAGVQISNERDPQTAEFFRPVVDLDRLLMNDKAVGFNEESPHEAEQNKQQKETERDSNGLSQGLLHNRLITS